MQYGIGGTFDSMTMMIYVIEQEIYAGTIQFILKEV